MRMINYPKLKNDKGFILVELMVVLVIIVLLLAILLPLVTGYIDDAKENAELSEARSIKVAVQKMLIDDEIDENFEDMIEEVDYDNTGLSEEGIERVEFLLQSKIGRVEYIEIDKKNVLTNFTYFTLNGSKILYNNGKYITEYIY